MQNKSHDIEKNILAGIALLSVTPGKSKVMWLKTSKLLITLKTTFFLKVRMMNNMMANSYTVP